MAWTPLLLPLLALCTGAAPTLPASQLPQDLELDLPQTLSSAQAKPQNGSLSSSFLSSLLLQALWPPMS